MSEQSDREKITLRKTKGYDKVENEECTDCQCVEFMSQYQRIFAHDKDRFRQQQKNKSCS